MYNKRA